MNKNLLTSVELDAWRSFRRSGEVISARIAREITRVTGLSAADFTILMQLSMAAAGCQRQRDLQSFLEWDKTRLSHQLTRMAGRGLVERLTTDSHTPVISLTEAGREQLALAAPVHQQGIKEHFASHLSAEELSLLSRIGTKLRESFD